MQTEAVRESSDISDFMYFSEMSLEDCCIQTKKLKTLKLGTQVSTTLPRCTETLEIPLSMGEIAFDYIAHPIIGELLYCIPTKLGTKMCPYTAYLCQISRHSDYAFSPYGNFDTLMKSRRTYCMSINDGSNQKKKNFKIIKIYNYAFLC